MGRGIAQLAALSGAQVRLSDSRAGASQAAKEELLATLGKLVQKGELDQVRADAAAHCLQPCDGLEALHDGHVIVEAIVEDLAAKKTLFSQLEKIVAADAILATNTSSNRRSALPAQCLAAAPRAAGTVVASLGAFPRCLSLHLKPTCENRDRRRERPGDGCRVRIDDGLRYLGRIRRRVCVDA